MEAEDHAQLRMLDVARDQAVDGTVELRADEFGQYPDHAHHRVERHAQEAVEAHAIKIRADFQKTLVAGDVVRIELRDLGLHGLIIAAVIERAAVVEADRVKGVDLAEVDVVGHVAAAEFPEFLEQERCRHDRRSGVERETVLFVHVGAAARRVEFLAHGNLVAARSQPDGGRKSAEAGANYDGFCLSVHARQVSDVVAGVRADAFPLL